MYVDSQSCMGEGQTSLACHLRLPIKTRRRLSPLTDQHRHRQTDADSRHTHTETHIHTQSKNCCTFKMSLYVSVSVCCVCVCHQLEKRKADNVVYPEPVTSDSQNRRFWDSRCGKVLCRPHTRRRLWRPPVDDVVSVIGQHQTFGMSGLKRGRTRPGTRVCLV